MVGDFSASRLWSGEMAGSDCPQLPGNGSGDRPLQDAVGRRGLIGTAAFSDLPVSTPQYAERCQDGCWRAACHHLPGHCWLGSALAAIIASACGLF